MPEPRFAKDKLPELTARDMTDVLYGAIQSMIEQGKPDNVAFHYFLPPIPFGPELAAFMDLGTEPAPVDNTDPATGEQRFSGNDLVRSAVNFALLMNHVPTTKTGLTNLAKASEDGAVVVDLNALIASGTTVSGVYKSVLDNCMVVNNGLSAADEARLAALEAELYQEPAPVAAAPPAPTEPAAALDLDALMSGGSIASVVADPSGVRQPTVTMQNYLATQAAFQQIQQAELDVRRTISPNDPNAGDILKRSRDRIEAAETMWRIQGRKDHVESLMAQIEMLSQGGMPKYVANLRRRFDANQIQAAVFATAEGAAALFEEAQFTALRPNGILRAPSAMKITLDSATSDTWTSMSSTSAGAGGSFGFPMFGGLSANASMKKRGEDLTREFFSTKFTLTLELLQGIVDRPGIDRAFLESRAYTTVHPSTKKPLDQISELVQLSNGDCGNPDGVLPLIVQSVYFVKSVVISSTALKTLREEELDEMSRGGGASFFGFGGHAEKSSKTTTVKTERARTHGELRLDGLFMVALGSRCLGLAPNPDFESFPDPRGLDLT